VEREQPTEKMADGQVEVTAAVEVAMMGDVVRGSRSESRLGSKWCVWGID